MKRALVVIVLAGVVSLLSAQSKLRPTEIQKLGVVDMERVYRAFPGDSRAEQEYNDRRAKIQEDLNRLNEELSQLRTRLTAAREAGKETDVKKLEAEYAQKTESTQEYYNKSKAELETKQAALSRSGFNARVGRAIEAIMKDNGYTIILHKSATLSFSPSVDITNLLISRLK